MNFLLEAALRETHLPSTPGTWSVNGSRAWFMEEVSPEAEGGGPLMEPGCPGRFHIPVSEQLSLCATPTEARWSLVVWGRREAEPIVGLHSTLHGG